MNLTSASDDTIVQQITIRGSAEPVFDALTRPEELVKWWGVAGKFQVTRMESDLRTGGKWRFIVATPAGAGVAVAGTYRQIERPRLLVYSWIREQEDPTETVVRWDLEENDGVTHVRVTHFELKSESLRARNSGWPMILGLLQSYIEESI
jgi:uncharacterized protein YndB with AHSA1/START domain